MVNYGNLELYYDQSHECPFIIAKGAPYGVPFYEDEVMLSSDVDTYKDMIDNAVYRFRHSRFYVQYKKNLYDIGLNRCQVLSNITTDMAKIEMHHNGISLKDITLLICGHLLKTRGRITTYDLVISLKRVHSQNKVPVVMLCKTIHDLADFNDDFYVPMQLTAGKWWELIYDYRYGLTYGLSKKIYTFIKKSEEFYKDEKDYNGEILKLRDSIYDWSEFNDSASFASSIKKY